VPGVAADYSKSHQNVGPFYLAARAAHNTLCMIQVTEEKT